LKEALNLNFSVAIKKAAFSAETEI